MAGLAIGLPRGCRGDVPGRGGLLGVLEEGLPGALHGERAEQYREDQCGEDTDMAGLDPWRGGRQRFKTVGEPAAGGRGRPGRRGGGGGGGGGEQGGRESGGVGKRGEFRGGRV